MRSKQKNSKVPADRVVKDIRRARRKPYSAEEKIRIVLEGLDGITSASINKIYGMARLGQQKNAGFQSAPSRNGFWL